MKDTQYFKIGDNVVKNKDFWVTNDFDQWGRGNGIGIIIEVFDTHLDIRWPAGKCYEDFNQIKRTKNESIDSLYVLATTSEHCGEPEVTEILAVSTEVAILKSYFKQAVQVPKTAREWTKVGDLDQYDISWDDPYEEDDFYYAEIKRVPIIEKDETTITIEKD